MKTPRDTTELFSMAEDEKCPNCGSRPWSVGDPVVEGTGCFCNANEKIIASLRIRAEAAESALAVMKLERDEAEAAYKRLVIAVEPTEMNRALVAAISERDEARAEANMFAGLDGRTLVKRIADLEAALRPLAVLMESVTPNFMGYEDGHHDNEPVNGFESRITVGHVRRAARLVK